MQNSNFKNTIVLKNIPSNIIEEAIIVLKENKKAWKLEKIENKKNGVEAVVKPLKKDYIVKEAEMIVSNYIDGIEKKEKDKKDAKAIEFKYKNLKKYAFVSTAIIIFQLIITIII